MRRMNSILDGHQGAFGPHQLLIFSHRELGLLVVPGQRQMDDAAFDSTSSTGGSQSSSSADDFFEQARLRQYAAVVMDLQRPDARRQIDDRGQLPRATAPDAKDARACARRRSSVIAPYSTSR